MLTANPYRYERFDPHLLGLVPKETEVIAVRPRDPWIALQAWRGRCFDEKMSDASSEAIERVYVARQAPFRSRVREIIRTAESYYYYPDLAKPWVRPAVQEISRICSKKNPMALWATIGPVSAGVVAHQASLQTNIPYVLDFRDPWELYYYESELRRPKRVTRSAKRMMYKLFEGAQSVVFLFSRMAECYWQAYRGALDPAKIHIIPNGFEGIIEEFRVKDSDRCTILYTGTLASYRYDTLLEAIKKLKVEFPNTARQLRLSFVGDGMEPLSRMAKELGISDLIQTTPPVSYDEVKCLNENAHAFLVLGRSQDRKGHELVAGAKLFGYFKARKPIIGVLPNDETKEILSAVGVDTIAESHSVSDIVNILMKVHACWSEGNLEALLPNVQACKRYGSESQTAALTQALECRPPEEPFVPGKFSLPLSLRETIKNKDLWYRKP